MSRTPSLPGAGTPAVRLGLALLGYAALHVGIRLLAPGAVEHDEAEQLLLSQTLALGYGKHPPLYAWLQHGVFQALGVGVLGLAVLKHACLLGLYGGTYLLARRLGCAPGLAGLTVLSLWLLPSLVWEAPRDLTHSVLAAALVPPTVHALVALAARPTVWRYAALGGVVGLGCLAKYNFALFATVLLAAALSVPSFRACLLDRRAALAALACAAVVGPHLAWMGAHPPVRSALDAFGHGNGVVAGAQLIGLARLVTEVLADVGAFLGPVLLVVALLVPAVRRPAPDHDPARQAARQLLERYLAALVATLVLSVPLVGLPGFKARWLLPLLVVTPLALLLRVPGTGPSAGAARALARVCIAVGVLALGLRLGEVWAGPALGHSSRLHLPIPELAARIRAAGFRQGTLVAGDTPLGGNLRLHFPESQVLTPDLADVAMAPASEPGQCLLAWRPRGAAEPPGRILAFARARLGRPPLPPASAILLQVPPGDSVSRPYGLGVLAVAPGASPCEHGVGPPAPPAAPGRVLQLGPDGATAPARP